MLGEDVDPTGLVWRLRSDLDIIAHQKKPLALCQLLRRFTVDQGLVDMDIEFHDGQEARAVSFRWDISKLTSQRTCVFRPNPLASEPSSDVKKASFGALFSGNYQKVPANKLCGLEEPGPEKKPAMKKNPPTSKAKAKAKAKGAAKGKAGPKAKAKGEPASGSKEKKTKPEAKKGQVVK
eukprot:Skav209738  [mRNA]  locus=scaffold2057:8982:10531:+ [translate_table: standard]